MIAQIIPLRRMPITLPYLDYLIPEELEKIVQIGQLVKIPLRSSSTYGIILHLTSHQRGNFKINKSIEEIINLSPALSLEQLHFLEEISSLYQTSLGFLLISNLFNPQPSKIKKFREEKNTIISEHKNATKPQAFFYSSDQEISSYFKKNILNNGLNLILVPDTSQIKKVFTSLSSELQSKTICFTGDIGDKTYFQNWLSIWKGDKRIVVGTRSALFLPWSNLQNIFLYNEGDPIYKSWDMAPRFHTRDAALLLSIHHRAQLHLIDHTPSVEIFYFTEKKVFNPSSEPLKPLKIDRTTLINISSQSRQSLLNETVIDKLSQIQTGTQFIFMHQRGSAHYIFCRDCNFVIVCPECGNSLTFHARTNELRCHTCHYHSPLFTACPSCHGTNIGMYGTGTEVVEKELKTLFPEKNIVRCDSDNENDKILTSSEQTSTIIIGTQYAWNRIHWDDINLMIIPDVDVALTIPEYKTNEHLWYSIRSAEAFLPEDAELLIQTRKPDHPVFSHLTNPSGFYEHELAERKKFKFPPYAYILKLYYGGSSQAESLQEARRLCRKLKDLTNTSQNITISEPIAMKPFIRKKKFWQVLIIKINYEHYKRDCKLLLSVVPSTWKVDLNPNSLLSF